MIYLSFLSCFLTVAWELVFNGRTLVIVIPYGIIIPAAIFIPRILAHGYKKYWNIKPQWLKALDISILALILVNIPGSLYFHRIGIQYDRFIHLASGFLATLIGLLVFVPFAKHHKLQKPLMLSGMFILMMSLNFMWEMWQITSDVVFKTQLFFDLNQSIRQDFIEDIAYASIGISLSVATLSLAYEKISALMSAKK